MQKQPQRGGTSHGVGRTAACSEATATEIAHGHLMLFSGRTDYSAGAQIRAGNTVDRHCSPCYVMLKQHHVVEKPTEELSMLQNAGRLCRGVD
jgi:hypothetical protein